MNLSIGPTGNVVQGSVLDVNRAALERKLRDYDSQLYTRWNPKKRSGMGCWEIWRRPDKKSATHVATWKGMSFFKVDYVINPLVHHILDVEALNYNILARLYRMDTFRRVSRGESWAAIQDYQEAKEQERLDHTNREEARYLIKQHRSEFRDLMDLTRREGVNPFSLVKKWKGST